MPTFFSRLLLEAHCHESSEGTGLRGCQLSGGVHSRLSGAPGWGNSRQRENMMTASPGPSSINNLLRPVCQCQAGLTDGLC